MWMVWKKLERPYRKLKMNDLGQFTDLFLVLSGNYILRLIVRFYFSKSQASPLLFS